SAASAQGRAFGVFAARARRVLALTGTVTGGYASDLFYLLYRLNPAAMKAAGYGYGDVGKFVAAYGCLEKVAQAPEGRAARSSRAGVPRLRVREKPGISPAVFSEHLLECTVFLELSDLACDLPPYREEVLLQDMSPDQRREYEALRAGLRGDVSRVLRAGSARVAGYVHAALSYPDRPAGNPPVTGSGGRVVAVPRDLPEWPTYPKEEALVGLCRAEISAGRRVFVYVAYTGTRDVSARLGEILSGAGLRVAVLRESVRPAAREEWIARQVAGGTEVVVANARLVEVGLDLIDFPTLVFFQTGYSLYTLRQASRRSWRIGQTKPVRVVFLAHRRHLQEAVLRLMGTKLRAALALEGRFSSEGLRAMAQGDDLGVELARVLVEGLESVEGLELFGAAWAPPEPAVQVAAEGSQLVWQFA
ncbi:MAG: helicase-related protein, partial [Bacillota bacterium]